MATQYAGRVRVGKLNVEENEAVCEQYNIRVMPTLLLFKDGSVTDQRIGLLSKDALVRLIDPQLA